METVQIATGVYIAIDKILFFKSYVSKTTIDSAKKAKAENKAKVFTFGKKASSILFLKDGEVILTHVTIDTLKERLSNFCIKVDKDTYLMRDVVNIFANYDASSVIERDVRTARANQSLFDVTRGKKYQTVFYLSHQKILVCHTNIRTIHNQMKRKEA